MIAGTAQALAVGDAWGQRGRPTGHGLVAGADPGTARGQVGTGDFESPAVPDLSPRPQPRDAPAIARVPMVPACPRPKHLTERWADEFEFERN